MPDAPGTIVPNHQLGGGGRGRGGHTVIIQNQNFDFRGADPGVFAKAQVFKEQVKQETVGAVLEMLNSGGVMAKAAGRRD